MLPCDHECWMEFAMFVYTLLLHLAIFHLLCFADTQSERIWLSGRVEFAALLSTDKPSNPNDANLAATHFPSDEGESAIPFASFQIRREITVRMTHGMFASMDQCRQDAVLSHICCNQSLTLSVRGYLTLHWYFSLQHMSFGVNLSVCIAKHPKYMFWTRRSRKYARVCEHKHSTFFQTTNCGKIILEIRCM